MTTEAEELHRASRAQGILEDPLVREAIDGIKATLIEQWRTTPLKDRELREQIWAVYVGAHAFERALQEHIETGKMAAIQLEQRRKRQANG